LKRLAAILFACAAAGLVFSAALHLWSSLETPRGGLGSWMWLHLVMLALAGGAFAMYRSRGESLDDMAPRSAKGRALFGALFLYCLMQGVLMMTSRPGDEAARWRFHTSAWVMGFSLLGFHLRRLAV
jgi:hypothetical protein